MRRRACAALLIALAVLPFSAPFSTCALQDLIATSATNALEHDTGSMPVRVGRGITLDAVQDDLRVADTPLVCAALTALPSDTRTGLPHGQPTRQTAPVPRSLGFAPLRI
jgi:hypothetical protein